MKGFPSILLLWGLWDCPSGGCDQREQKGQ